MSIAKQDILSLTSGIDLESSSALEQIVAKISALGHSASVMDHNGTPSDHKVWIDGDAWTLLSSDYQGGPVRWDPYIQAGLPAGATFDANGIPSILPGGGGSAASAVGGTVPLPTNDNPNGYLLTAQLGLLEDDLAYRLALLCVNVLQPLKDQYPNIVVISGFRQTNSGIGQHELGEAVDIQIRNQTPELLYEVADYIQKNLNFDQVILNWTTIGDKQGWIHVSFSATSLRNQVLTKDFADTFHEGLFLVDPLTGEAAASALRDQAVQDTNIMAELQNIQTRQTRQGTRPTAVPSPVPAGASAGSGRVVANELTPVPGVIYPLGASWSAAPPDTAVRYLGDLLLQGTFGQTTIDYIVAKYPASGAAFTDGTKVTYAVQGFYTVLKAATGTWELITSL